MNPVYQLLYEDMLRDIARCQELPHLEKDNVESCFWIARNYWTRLQTMQKLNGFSDDKQEIIFYREVKPVFTSHIEYFSLLAEALQFEPALIPFPAEMEGKLTESDWIRAWQVNVCDYWRAEKQRGERFYRKHQLFLDYCDSGNREDDGKYFFPRNCLQGDVAQRRSHNRDTELFTPHEEILTAWEGFKLYKEYIKKKVHEPVGS